MCKRTWERKIKNCIIKDWWSVDLEILDDETIIYNLVGCLVIKKHYIYNIRAMVKSRYIGDGHPTFNRNPYNWYINPYEIGLIFPFPITWKCHGS